MKTLSIVRKSPASWLFLFFLIAITFTFLSLSTLPDGEIEAVEDYYVITEGDSLTFNVLENDIGEELKVISYSSQTGGSLSEGEEEGEFTFYSEIAGTGQEQFAFFEYVIQDKYGETDETYLAILIESLYPEFIVQIDRDCASAEANGTYTLTTLMMGGKPPYYYITNWTDGEIVQQPDIRTIDIV